MSILKWGDNTNGKKEHLKANVISIKEKKYVIFVF